MSNLNSDPARMNVHPTSAAPGSMDETYYKTLESVKEFSESVLAL
jgi:hypothetical protein